MADYAISEVLVNGVRKCSECGNDSFIYLVSLGEMVCDVCDHVVSEDESELYEVYILQIDRMLEKGGFFN
jgi:hypothetical protein